MAKNKKYVGYNQMYVNEVPKGKPFKANVVMARNLKEANRKAFEKNEWWNKNVGTNYVKDTYMITAKLKKVV